MAKTFKTIFEEVKQDVVGMLSAQLKLRKLEALEKGVPVAVRTGYMTVVAVVALLFFLFLLITASFALGLIFCDAGSEAYFTLRGITLGFLCLSGVQLLIVLLMLLLSNTICNSIGTNIITKQLDAMDQEERETADATLMTDPTQETTILNGAQTHIYTESEEGFSEVTR